MHENKIKIWVGLGAFVLGGAATASAGAPDAETTKARTAAPAVEVNRTADPFVPPVPRTLTAIQIAQGGEGGEGGEADHGEIGRDGGAGPGGEGGEGGEMGHGGEMGQGGEGGEAGAAAGLTPDAALASRLMMMQGHLRAGEDLWQAGKADNAALHLAHPQAELYEKVKGGLARHNIQQLRDDLQRTVDLAAGGAGVAEVQAALDTTQGKIAGARDLVVAKLSADDAARALVALMKGAAHEYDESLDDGRFVNIEEYQDARGFVLVARDFAAGAQSLRARDARALASIEEQLGKLAGALATPVPPQSPTLTTSEMYGAIARIELAASNFAGPGALSRDSEGGEGGEEGHGGEGGEMGHGGEGGEAGR